MNGAHLHLILNHVPVLGTVFCLLLLLYALGRRSDELARAAFIALVLVGASAVGAYLSGDGAEEVVEHLSLFEAARLEAHEDTALAALLASVALGLVALAALWTHRGRPLARRLVVIAALLSASGAVLMARTATLGGEIMHGEIRAGHGVRADAADQDDDD